jgi:hypothetical protein
MLASPLALATGPAAPRRTFLGQTIKPLSLLGLQAA